ncbi:zf-HC2 domain-containing protein [Catenuloplanes japonicus]|uniref:zf-HC2 domain-containing protein n=1 Tax=Catenuloplanes japonicus TaxID=33876 RepID=UPI0005259966|nr:zf-HC2 domain-containing protein [Catenuloplanes japonicus]
MTDDVCAEPQLRSALGLYLSGVLHDEERTAVELHLAHCAQCLADAEALGEAVAMLALLTEDDRRELVDEFGVRAPGATPEPAPVTPVTPVASPSVAVRRPARGPGGGDRPAGRPRSSRRSRLTLAGAGLGVVLLFAAGFALGRPLVAGWLGAGDSVTLVTNAADQTTGASLTVTLSQQGEKVTMEATVDGLRPGAFYRFSVTDLNQNTQELAALTGTGSAQTVERTSPLPLDRVDRFSVTAEDGSLVVVAVVDRDSASTGPR